MNIPRVEMRRAGRPVDRMPLGAMLRLSNGDRSRVASLERDRMSGESPVANVGSAPARR